MQPQVLVRVDRRRRRRRSPAARIAAAAVVVLAAAGVAVWHFWPTGAGGPAPAAAAKRTRAPKVVVPPRHPRAGGAMPKHLRPARPRLLTMAAPVAPAHLVLRGR